MESYIRSVKLEQFPVELSSMPKGKISPQDSVLLIIATMLAKHQQSEKETTLSSTQLEDEYIEQAISSSISDVEQRAVDSGSVKGALQWIKELLDELQETLGPDDAQLKTYIEGESSAVDGFKYNKQVREELAKVQEKEKKWNHDWEERNKYKEEMDHTHNVAQKAKDLSEVDHYNFEMMLLAGTTHKDKATAKFSEKIEKYEGQENAECKNFLNSIGDSANLVSTRLDRQTQLDLDGIQEHISSVKGEAEIVEVLGSLTNNNS